MGSVEKAFAFWVSANYQHREELARALDQREGDNNDGAGPRYSRSLRVDLESGNGK